MDTETLRVPLRTVGRVARDISDGLILLDSFGTVQFINPSAGRLLGSSALKEGVTYASFMAADSESANDAFHQFVLDSVYDKSVSHSGTATYTRPDGSLRYLSVNTSYAFSDDGTKKLGVILRFSDITELQEAKIKHDDSIKVLVGVIGMLAIWDYVFAIWENMGEPISSNVLTVIIEGIGVLASLFALRYTSITVAEFGLGTRNLKRAVLVDSTLTAAVMCTLVLVRLLARRFFPAVVSPDEPLFYWNVLRPIDLLYIPNVVLQEFLVRGVTQGSIERILPENYSPAVSIIVSSLFFGSIHIHKGIVYMVGAALLLAFFGALYKKQKTIWGLCIPHLFLSWSLRVIWGF